MKATLVTLAALFAAFAWSCVGGTTVCPGGGHGGDTRCDGAKIEWCSVSGGASDGALFNSGTNTAVWMTMDECAAPSTCMMLASAGGPAQPVCPVNTDAGSADAGGFDAGGFDAGSADAGSLDAGSSDDAAISP